MNSFCCLLAVHQRASSWPANQTASQPAGQQILQLLIIHLILFFLASLLQRPSQARAAAALAGAAGESAGGWLANQPTNQRTSQSRSHPASGAFLRIPLRCPSSYCERVHCLAERCTQHAFLYSGLTGWLVGSLVGSLVGWLGISEDYLETPQFRCSILLVFVGCLSSSAHFVWFSWGVSAPVLITQIIDTSVPRLDT